MMWRAIHGRPCGEDQVTSRIAVTKGKVASKVGNKSEVTELAEVAMKLRKEQEVNPSS